VIQHLNKIRQALGVNNNRSMQTKEGGIVIHGGITINLITSAKKKSVSNVHSGQGIK
jgi:hypothetical protein